MSSGRTAFGPEMLAPPFMPDVRIGSNCVTLPVGWTFPVEPDEQTFLVFVDMPRAWHRSENDPACSGRRGTA
jgi:hypothetical protein